MWGDVEKETGEAREAELAESDRFFKPVLDKGARMMRHENTRDSAHDILRRIIQNYPIALKIQREMVDEKKDVSRTVAADELQKEVMVQTRQYRNELRALKEEMAGVCLALIQAKIIINALAEAIRVKDREKKREAELKAFAFRDEMTRVREDAERRAYAYFEEKQELERQMQVLSENARREREEHRRRMMSIM